MTKFDKATTVRKDEKLAKNILESYLKIQITGFSQITEIEQFPGGYSNLTYLIHSNMGEFVLRRPPLGANIKSAHDMGREYKILSAVSTVYDKVPKVYLHCEDESILGSPFYVMERVKGVILRGGQLQNGSIKPSEMKAIGESLVDNLVKIHQIDLDKSGLISMNKGTGYVERQVKGWTKRYFNAQTDELNNMNSVAEWLAQNMPKTENTAFIHNDYKFDNLVLNAGKYEDIIAVLDWEMATVGDNLMDLGTSLAYWVENDDSQLLKMFNVSWLEGNLTREEVAQRYIDKMGDGKTKLEDMLFYYVFGAFKLGVILQQIYARYKKGLTQDKRFAILIEGVKACAKNGVNAIKLNRISQLNT
jgi:aminoglycoside phosphotransferase (APT) family kinase protein